MKYLIFLFIPVSAHSLTVGTTNYMGTVPTAVYQSTSGPFGSTITVLNLGTYPLVMTSTGMNVTQNGANPLDVFSTASLPSGINNIGTVQIIQVSSFAISKLPNVVGGSSFSINNLPVNNTIPIQSTNVIVNVATGTFFCSSGTVQTSSLSNSTVAWHNATVGKTFYIENWEVAPSFSTTSLGSIQLLGYAGLENPSFSVSLASVPFCNTANGTTISPANYSVVYQTPIPTTGSATIVVHSMTTTKTDWTGYECGYEK